MKTFKALLGVHVRALITNYVRSRTGHHVKTHVKTYLIGMDIVVPEIYDF